MTATYQKLGLTFLYPENWKLTDETDSDLPCSVSLETPAGDAIWSIHIHDFDADPDEILKSTLMTLQETYPDLEASRIDSDLRQFPGTGIDALFYCLDFLVKARLQVIPTDDYQLLFWFQAEDREFDKLEPVFQAMTVSAIGYDPREAESDGA
jgi:hypothetical protein